MKYLLILILAAIAFIYMKNATKNPKKLNKIKELGMKIINFFIPADMSVRLSKLKQDSFNALNDESTISNLLMYSHYVQEEDGEDKFGVYSLRTGRQGIILEIFPPSYLGDDVEKSIQSLLGAVQGPDIVVNFFTYASPNIQKILNEYEEHHHCNIKVRNPDVLKGLTKDKLATYSKWSEESILPYSDFRLRNFYNLVSIVFPQNTSLSEIKSTYFSVKGSLATMNPRNFRADSLLVMLHDIFKPGEKITEGEVDLYRQMNIQFAQGVEIKLFPDDPDIRIGNGKMLARVLTTQKFPKKMRISDMQNALFDPMGRDAGNPIPCPFIASLTIHMEDPIKLKKEVLKKCRTNLKQTGKIKYTDKKARPDIQEVQDEAERTISYIEKVGQIPYTGMHTIVLFDKNKDILDRVTSTVKKKFHDIPTVWDLQVEKFTRVALLQFLYSLPLQFFQPIRKKILHYRYDLLLKANNSYIAPIVSGFKGFGRNHNVYVDRTGQLFRISPFESEGNYNMIIIGPPGSGKSVFCNHYLSDGLSSGWRVWMFDLGDSYLHLNEEIGGQSLKFTEENTICLNFFTHINTRKKKIEATTQKYFETEVSMTNLLDEDGYVDIIHEDEFDTIVPMIGIMAGLDLRSTGNYEKYGIAEEAKAKKKTLSIIIESALNIAFLRKGREAGMADVHFAIGEIVKKLDEQGKRSAELADFLYQNLAPYSIESGKFYQYMNGAFNVNMDNSFFLLEQEELNEKGELLEVVCYGFLQRIAQISFLDENRKYPKMVGFDESAPLLKSELFVHYLDDFSRRLRKYYGAITIITQYIADFHYNARASSLLSGASYKIFLEHEKSKIEESDNKGQLNLEEFPKELFKSLRKTSYYSEFLFCYRDINIVGRLPLTPTELALYTTNPNDRAKRESLIKKHGISKSDSLFMFAKLREGLTENQALQELAKRNQTVSQKYWRQKVRYALTKKTVIPYIQAMVDAENNVFAFEVLMRIVDEDENIYTPEKFDLVAKNLGLFVKLQMQLIEKTFLYFSKYPDFNFSMNITADDLVDANFIEYLSDKIEYFNISKQFIIEVDSQDLIDHQNAIDNIKKLKNLGVRMAIDKVSPKNINFEQLLDIKPSLIKLDAELIKSSSNGGFERAKKVNELSNILGLETVAMHVSEHNIYTSAKKIGAKYFQGYYFGEPTSIRQLQSQFEIVEEIA